MRKRTRGKRLKGKRQELKRLGENNRGWRRIPVGKKRGERPSNVSVPEQDDPQCVYLDLK